VALLSYASILAMGAPYYNDDTGYIKVYCADNDGGKRVQLGPTI